MFEGWQPKLTPQTGLEFETRIADAMQETAEFRGPDDGRYVFDLLNERISRGEVEDMRACLPKEIRAYWAEP
ncbi:hypothetical protein GCM10007385_39060 [Tateyamaria omphalii]|nr:hypothetical protein GCM10007385_39060 [Tateyamaria omphalii]